MERQLSIPIYATAFIISVMIFVTGVYVGNLIDKSNLQDISGEVSSISNKVASVQLLLLMEGNSSSFCPVYLSELDSIDDEVERVGYKLSYLEDQKQVYDQDLKKQYFVLEAESYLLSKKVKELCGDKSALLIHFYSNKACTNCKQQGIEILKMRDDLSSRNITVKLFSLDGDLGSPVADAFKSQYSVTAYPSVVINGRTYSGYRNAEELKQLITEPS